MCVNVIVQPLRRKISNASPIYVRPPQHTASTNYKATPSDLPTPTRHLGLLTNLVLCLSGTNDFFEFIKFFIFGSIVCDLSLVEGWGCQREARARA